MSVAGMDTQSRILEAAWALVRERGAGAVRIGEIAAAAGVSRQLVYFHFENRAGLLLAMARHRDVESGFVDRVADTRTLPPVEGLEGLLRAWYGYIPEILPVAPRGSTGWRIYGRPFGSPSSASPGTVGSPKAGPSRVRPTGSGRGATSRRGSIWSANAAGSPTTTRSGPYARSWPRSWRRGLAKSLPKITQMSDAPGPFGWQYPVGASAPRRWAGVIDKAPAGG